MARPQKDGLDYFPFDVGLLKDIKLRKPKINHGYVAVMIYISLLSLLYRDKGYYIDYSDKDCVVWEVLSDLQGKYQPTPETVEAVIEDLVACELFSGGQFKSKIITSKRSQETYYSATVERKTVNINNDIWLLSLEDMKKLSVKHCYYLENINRPINEVNRPINGVNQSNNPQSKVKESKVNEIKEEESKELENLSFSVSELALKYFDNGGTKATLELNKLIDIWGMGFVIQVLDDLKSDDEENLGLSTLEYRLMELSDNNIKILDEYVDFTINGGT